ncbi:MAG: oxidoreductase [Cohnella sp.]|nr:oxidoreductase [Cohnella sp.]
MKLGVIGYGARIRWMVSQMMNADPACRVAAIADPLGEEIKAEIGEQQAKDITFFRSADELLATMKLDGVLIGTRCSLHTEMALKVFSTGLPLYLEKPIATSLADLHRLKGGWERTNTKTVVSFPLRLTPIVQAAKQIIESGKLGTIEHVQAVNNVPYGGVYFHHWYRDEDETGGLFLQKATHDFDYINYLLGLTPTAICAMTSKQVFKGDKPAGLRCADCDENRTCADSVVRTDLPDRSQGEYCSFAVDTGNEDSGSALIRYETGMHVSYSQNFFARQKAAARGARLLGYKGTMEFDFYTNVIKVYMHHESRVETYEFASGDESHGGGDAVLADNFIGVMRGTAPSRSPLESGLLSALMCLKARESSRTDSFQSISWDHDIPV